MQKTSLCLLVVLLACADTPTELPDTSRDRIVFASNASGDYNIFAMDQDGSNRVQLTTMDTEDLNPAPSPDGTRIAFVSFDGALGGGDIYVMNADGTGVTQLTGLPGRFAGVATAPSWSPDRQKILFTGFLAEYPDLFVMSADGSGWTNLTHDNSVRDEYGAWSPDGRQIAFVRWIGVGAPAHRTSS
jgi:Tol biopolymer transport system component